MHSRTTRPHTHTTHTSHTPAHAPVSRALGATSHNNKDLIFAATHERASLKGLLEPAHTNLLNNEFDFRERALHEGTGWLNENDKPKCRRPVLEHRHSDLPPLKNPPRLLSRGCLPTHRIVLSKRFFCLSSELLCLLVLLVLLVAAAVISNRRRRGSSGEGGRAPVPISTTSCCLFNVNRSPIFPSLTSDKTANSICSSTGGGVSRPSS